ncbi:MAG: rod-binding protein [Terricaulis sp.]
MVDFVPPSTTARLPAAGLLSANEPPEELRKIAEQFESVFLNEMMAPMFQGIETDGLGGGGMGEEMFRPMLIEQYASALSSSGGIGLADAIVKELMRMQTIVQPEATDGADR